MTVRSLMIASLVVLACWQKFPAQETSAELATKTYRILEEHCYRCHGQNGSNEGGFGYVLEFELLVPKKVKPMNPNESRLFRRMGIAQDMPPDGEEPRPTPADIEVVKNWIEAGAPLPLVIPDKPRPFVSLEDELESMQGFLRKTNRDERKFVRFFTLRHLHNIPSKKNQDLRIYQAALSKLINSLSWKPEIVVPTPVDEEKILFAVDIRKLDWDRKDLWKGILRIYPYGLEHDRYPENRQINDLAEDVYARTQTVVPVIRADWFIATASRPPLYHLLLQLPKNARELEKRLEVDIQHNFLRGEVKRAGFSASGVSGHNRLVERHSALHGAYWKSYDFKSSVGFGNLFVFPLGPRFDGNPFQRQAFQHAGGEIIFNLPNGLQGYMLVDANDDRIDEGPIEIVSDGSKVSGTPSIVNGLSCMSCHQHGMIHFEDKIREGHILGGDSRTFLQRIYPVPKEMDLLVQKDEERFLRSLDETTSPFLRVGRDKDREITTFTEPISAIARWYLSQELSSVEASRELGLEKEEGLEATITANQRLQEVGLFPLSRKQTIKREVWEHTDFLVAPYQEAASQLKLGVPVTIR